MLSSSGFPTRRRYKELDVFKLDIIARELKKLDGRINLLKLSGQVRNSTFRIPCILPSSSVAVRHLFRLSGACLQNLGGVFKAMNQPAEKDSAVRYAQRVTNVGATSRVLFACGVGSPGVWGQF